MHEQRNPYLFSFFFPLSSPFGVYFGCLAIPAKLRAAADAFRVQKRMQGSTLPWRPCPKCDAGTRLA
jgi:hypothetical protein